MGNTSKVIPFITLATTILLLAFDVTVEDFSITETHITFIGMMLGTFGLGGIYVEAIKKGFGKYQDYKEQNKTEP